MGKFRSLWRINLRLICEYAALLMRLTCTYCLSVAVRVVVLNAGLSMVVFSLACNPFFWIISFVFPSDLILLGYPLPSHFLYTFSLMTLLLFVTGIYFI